MQITPFKEQIKRHLDEMAEKDELFAKTYQKENKNLDECIQYIYQEVKKMAKDQTSVGVSDDEVYSLAVHYYDKDDIKVGAPIKAEVAHAETSKADEASDEAEAPKAEKTQKRRGRPKKTEVKVEEDNETEAEIKSDDEDDIDSMFPLFD